MEAGLVGPVSRIRGAARERERGGEGESAVSGVKRLKSAPSTNRGRGELLHFALFLQSFLKKVNDFSEKPNGFSEKSYAFSQEFNDFLENANDFWGGVNDFRHGSNEFSRGVNEFGREVNVFRQKSFALPGGVLAPAEKSFTFCEGSFAFSGGSIDLREEAIDV